MNTVLIATERQQFGDLLRRKLEFEPDINVLAVCHAPDDLLDAVALHTPDVILLQMPERAQLTRSIVHLCEWTQVVWIGDRDMGMMDEALWAGAKSVLDITAAIG